jgi:hypothetical protein
METQCCYVCGKYFEDKVKLGLHLTPCYNEAVSVRKELWHPHPLDLVDEQRYTEYMKGRFREREQQIEHAEKKGISLVTADNFEAMRGTLGPTRHNQNRPSTRERVAHVVPPIPASPVRTSTPQTAQLHQQQVAQPVRVVATGVTMLRNELHSEIQELKKLREEEIAQAAARSQQFNDLLSNFNALKVGDLRPQAQQQLGSQPLLVHTSSATELDGNVHRYVPVGPAVPLPPVASRPTTQTDSVPAQRTATAPPYGVDDTPCEVMEDGRIRCGTCGKFFGKKGFQVHSQRCYRGADDFTFSRDARFEKNHPEPGQPVPQLQAQRYASEGTVGGGGGREDPWTQFMITYPRPVIDEKPKTAKERIQAAEAAKQKAEMNKMVAREMSGAPTPPEEREATVPCGKCGRYFYASRVAKHEASCVAKLKR